MDQLRQNLNRTNGLLAKLRYQVSSSLLETIYLHFSTPTYAMQHMYGVKEATMKWIWQREHKIKLSE